MTRAATQNKEFKKKLKRETQIVVFTEGTVTDGMSGKENMKWMKGGAGGGVDVTDGIAKRHPRHVSVVPLPNCCAHRARFPVSFTNTYSFRTMHCTKNNILV